MSEAANMIDKRLKTRVKVKAGPHMVGVTFHRRNGSESDEPLQPHERDHDLQNMNGLPMVDHVTVTGPFNSTGPGDTPSRRRIFTCRPAKRRRRSGLCPHHPLDNRAARLSSSGDRRRHEAVARPLRSRPQQGLRGGIEQGVRLILANPKFIFRTEAEPPKRRAASQRPRDGLAAVVLPLEQHPGRRAAERGGAEPAAISRPCWRSRCAGC